MFYTFVYIFHILEFPGIISFPENYPETIRISWIREIAFKVETLATLAMLFVALTFTLSLVKSSTQCRKSWDHPPSCFCLIRISDQLSNDYEMILTYMYRQLRVKRALSIFKDVHEDQNWSSILMIYYQYIHPPIYSLLDPHRKSAGGLAAWPPKRAVNGINGKMPPPAGLHKKKTARRRGHPESKEKMKN